MDDVIAEAVGVFKGEALKLCIYRPQIYVHESSEFICRFSIVGNNVKYANRSLGIDSFQSLILSLKMIAFFLKYDEVFEGERIDWLGGDLDLPEF